jgi:hypothetical protein
VGIKVSSVKESVLNVLAAEFVGAMRFVEESRSKLGWE